MVTSPIVIGASRRIVARASPAPFPNKTENFADAGGNTGAGSTHEGAVRALDLDGLLVDPDARDEGADIDLADSGLAGSQALGDRVLDPAEGCVVQLRGCGLRRALDRPAPLDYLGAPGLERIKARLERGIVHVEKAFLDHAQQARWAAHFLKCA